MLSEQQERVRGDNVKSMYLKILHIFGEILCIWITENSQSAASESVIVHFHLEKLDFQSEIKTCSTVTAAQNQVDSGVISQTPAPREYSVSQILLWHEMSQHISYKRDYPSLKVK